MMCDPFENFELNPTPVANQVKTVLRQAIIEGRFTPGDKLPNEGKLAERFQVSKTALREALGQLTAEGLIEKRRGAMGGSFVAKGDPTRIFGAVESCYRLGGLTVEEVIESRRIMEPVVLELACERRTEEDLEAIRMNLEDTEKALAEGQTAGDKMIEFHRLIADSCHNRFVSAIMNAILNISREFTALLPFSSEDVRQDYDYNQRFYECLEGRRKDDARTLMMGHFELSRKLIEKYRTQKKDE
jgi:GntR family transcriptional repressor for pyruvate dehydrogenase complex